MSSDPQMNSALAAVKEARKTPPVADGVRCYDLSYPASSLWPTMTPLRNRLPRQEGGPDHDRFVTMGEEDSGVACGMPGGDGEDIKTMQAFRLLLKTMFKEEMAILAGNRSLQLGRPTPPNLSAKLGASSELKCRMVNVAVVALTAEGWLNSNAKGHGIATRKIVTGANGENYTFFGGSSDRSPLSTILIAPDDVLSASVDPVRGAVAYGWFAGLPEHEALQCITTTNSVVFDQPILTGGQPLSAIVEDCSATPQFAYDGLLTSAFLAPDAYVDIRPTGEAGKGTPLTRSERGAVTEIDCMLAGMAERGLATDVIFVNLREMAQICALFGTDEVAVYPGLGAKVTNGIVEGGGHAPLLSLHPRVPPGTVVGWADKCCIVSEEEAAAGTMPKDSAAVLTRQDYYQIDWPTVTRQQQTGVYVEEWLQVREPAAMGVITNIGS
jgi:hypothetical protein